MSECVYPDFTPWVNVYTLTNDLKATIYPVFCRVLLCGQFGNRNHLQRLLPPLVQFSEFKKKKSVLFNMISKLCVVWWNWTKTFRAAQKTSQINKNKKKEKIYYNVQWLGKINARIFKHQVLLFRGNFRNPCSLSNADPSPRPPLRQRLSGDWGTREKRDDGNERRARAGGDGKETEREGKGLSLFLPFPSLPSSPLSLIILNSNITQWSRTTGDEAGPE